MHIWTDLAAREFAFFVVLLALGIGPAAFLSSRMDPVVRLVLAPALGMCVGVCVTLTLVKWEPVQSTYWVLVPTAAISVAVAIWRVRRTTFRLSIPLRELMQLALVALAVLLPASSTLHSQHTVGPVAWNVYDAVGYVSETDGQQTQSIDVARNVKPPLTNMTEEYWRAYAIGYQNLDVTALEGSVNDILGLGSTDTQSPFMIVILLVGALGAFAAVRYATESRTWAAVIAGALFGGPFFMQLWADSSQAALSGLALLFPFILIGGEAVRGRLADRALLALVTAGLLSVYPLYVPYVIGGTLLVLVYLAIRAVVRRRPSRGQVLGAVWRSLLVVLLSIVLTPVAFSRDFTYWREVINSLSGLPVAGLPVYHLPIQVLPGWLLQTHEFYLLGTGIGGLGTFLLTVLLPLGVIAVAFGWWRRASVLLAFALACAVLAEYVWLNQSCSYCVQRNLLPLAPMAAVALALGVAALWAARGWILKLAAGGVVVLLVIAVGGRMLDERADILGTAYFLSSSERSVMSYLPRRDATVNVEGFNEAIRAPGELPLVVALVNERTGGRASVALDSTDNFANAYIGPADQPNLLKPDYRFVLTRFAGVVTSRRALSISNGVALQERMAALDVTPVADLGVPSTPLNPSGFAWVQGQLLHEPLQFKVIGGAPDVPAWVHLTLDAGEPVSVPVQPGVSARQIGSKVSICIRALGSAPVRTAAVTMSFAPMSPRPPGTKYYLPQPVEGVRLVSMIASEHLCRL